MSQEDMVYGLVPDHVRSKENFREGFEPEKYSGILVDNYELAILGVPQQEEFLDRLAIMYEDCDFEGEIYAKAGVVDALEQNDRMDVDSGQLNTIEYDREPSRRADLQELNRQVDSEDNIMLTTWSYNVPRTNYEADEVLDQSGVEDGYALDFQDFDDMKVGKDSLNSLEWIKGSLYTLGDSVPQTDKIASGIADRLPTTVEFEGKGFDYNVEAFDDPHYVTVGIPWSDDRNEIDKRHSMESFKNNLIPGWQGIKDVLKGPGRKLSDDFNF